MRGCGSGCGSLPAAGGHSVGVPVRRRNTGSSAWTPDTALVRYPELPAPVKPFPISPPLRILAMISAPSDLPPLDVEEEWDKLSEARSADLAGLGWCRWTAWRMEPWERCDDGSS